MKYDTYLHAAIAAREQFTWFRWHAGPGDPVENRRWRQYLKFYSRVIHLDELKNIKIRMLQAEIDDLKERLATAEKLIDYMEEAAQ